MEANLSFAGAVVLKLGRSIAAGFIHFVVARPSELDRVAPDGAVDFTGNASRRERTTRFAEQNVCFLHHVGEVGFIVGHLDDAPLTLNARDGASKSLGKRIRS